MIATSRPANAFISVDLPTLGGPGDDDGEAFAQPGRRIRSRERPVNPLDCAARRVFNRFKREIRSILDVGEIDLRFDRRHRLEQACPDRLAFAAERPAGDALSLLSLRLCFGFDQIGEPFHLGKIDLSIHERAPREFAGFGEAQSGNERQRLDAGRGDGPPSRHADLRPSPRR